MHVPFADARHEAQRHKTASLEIKLSCAATKTAGAKYQSISYFFITHDVSFHRKHHALRKLEIS